MQKKPFITESRRATPWTWKKQPEAAQLFIDTATRNAYETRHRPVSQEDNEILYLNSLDPEACPYCGDEDKIRYGKTGSGINKYKCKNCGRYYNILTGTIFQDHKIPISEWIDFCAGIFRYQSFNSISKSNRNAYTTTKYWLSKLFLILEDYQKDIMLGGRVYLDETFIKIRKGDIEYKQGYKEYRGISRNQMCIGMACDKMRTIAICQGQGKTTKEGTSQCFISHIKRGSTLIHDEEKAHDILVKELGLESRCYNARCCRSLSDKENPLYQINRRCFLLKRFLSSHSGFIRYDIQG